MSSDPLTQARDRIAELCGWTKFSPGQHQIGALVVVVLPPPMDEVWADKCGYRYGRPIPACLNFVSKVWPEDAELFSHRAGGKNHCAACYGVAQFAPPRTGDELADRMTLLADVLAWLQSNDPPAFDAAVEKIRKEIKG